jgi:hypothetical protein
MVEFEWELREQSSVLRPEQRRQVLEYARSLSEGARRGVPGEVLLRFAGTLSNEEAEAFKAAVEEGCASVDTNDW